MMINKKNIEKLKVVKINSNNIMVENLKGKRGIIYISNVSHLYINDLKHTFAIDDVIYGYLIKTEGTHRFYSLKIGHTREPITNLFDETGGGYLGIHYLLNKLEKKEN